MTYTRTPIESHRAHSDWLLDHAGQQLAAGDRLQASEKAWGAVAHCLKDISIRHGLRYVSHADAFRAITRLSHEIEIPRLEELFHVANGLHRNFYEDAQPIDLIERDIERVKELLHLMRQADRHMQENQT